MNFADRMKKIIQKSLENAKLPAMQAKQKAGECGQQDILIREINGLEKDIKNRLLIVGNKVYSTLMKKHRSNISKNTPEIRDILLEIMNLEKWISEKALLLKQVD